MSFQVYDLLQATTVPFVVGLLVPFLVLAIRQLGWRGEYADRISASIIVMMVVVLVMLALFRVTKSDIFLPGYSDRIDVAMMSLGLMYIIGLVVGVIIIEFLFPPGGGWRKKRMKKPIRLGGLVPVRRPSRAGKTTGPRCAAPLKTFCTRL